MSHATQKEPTAHELYYMTFRVVQLLIVTTLPLIQTQLHTNDAIDGDGGGGLMMMMMIIIIIIIFNNGTKNTHLFIKISLYTYIMNSYNFVFCIPEHGYMAGRNM